MISSATFDRSLRRERQRVFSLERTTGGRTVPLELGGRAVEVYANANFSIYSGQRCNARCPFCVEELRPLSRGVTLESQKRTLADDALYFEKLERALAAVAPVDPTVSITGGEASIDPRLPGILERVARAGARKRVLTTNGSGLLAERSSGGRTIDHVVRAGFHHLNVSRASSDEDENQRIMRIGSGGVSNEHLRECVRIAQEGGVEVRFSCVLLTGVNESVEDVVRYVRWARSLGVTRLIFRQLMKHDPERVLEGPVTRFSDERRVDLWSLLDRLEGDARFTPVRQILGYYYYVEVYEFEGSSVVFEGADLGEIARRTGDVVHELIFHPSGTLNSTWQPWDGVLLR